MVRAFEEADPEGKLLPLGDRQRATSAVLPSGTSLTSPESSREALRERSQALQSQLDEGIPMLPRARRITRLGAGLLPLALVLPFLLGLSTSALGPARHINLLSLPLLGYIAWNLVMYLVFVLVWLVKGGKGGAPGQGLGRIIAPILTLGYLKRALRRLKGHLPRDAAIAGRAISGYLTAWRRISALLVEARARRLLHSGSAALMAGMVAGMYGRGLAFRYQATWESTFLDSSGAWKLLSTLLGPASRLTGVDIPSRALFEAAQGPAGSGDAAPWIHLFAATAFLFVILPRGVLAVVETLRLSRLRRRVPLDLAGAYYRRVLAAGRGDRLLVEVFSYSYQLDGSKADRLQSALLDLFGSRAALRLRPSVDYGAEELPETDGDAGPGTERARVVVFNLAQTPEAEVHGELVRRYQSSKEADAESLLVVVDASSYRQRLLSQSPGGGGSAQERLESRRKTWQRTLGKAGCAWVDLESMEAIELHDRLTQAVTDGGSSPSP